MMQQLAVSRYSRPHFVLPVLGLAVVATTLVMSSPAAAATRQRSATKPLDLEIRLSDVKGSAILPDTKLLPRPSSVTASETWREEAEPVDRVERPEIPNRRRTSDGDADTSENLLKRIRIPLFRVKMQPSL